MNPARLRVIVLAFFLVPASSFAQGQAKNWREDPAIVAGVRRHAEDVDRAVKLTEQARDAMRLGQFDKATLLCDRAAIDLNALGGREYATEAYEVLAESALLQGHPAEALRQCDACAPRLVVQQRFGMTKALALIGVGRAPEAREIVLAQIGTSDKPGFFRRAYHIHQFPMDRDSSAAALTATAYLVRAAWWQAGPARPEVVNDLQAALGLAPDSASVRLQWANSLAARGSYGAARAEFAKAQSLGDKYIHDMAKLDIAKMERDIAADAVKKAAGSNAGP